MTREVFHIAGWMRNWHYVLKSEQLHSVMNVCICIISLHVIMNFNIMLICNFKDAYSLYEHSKQVSAKGLVSTK